MASTVLKDKDGLKMKTILVTGCAGFIGANLTLRLLDECRHAAIIGIDNLNDYYDIRLKEYRLNRILENASKSECPFLFKQLDISDPDHIKGIFSEFRPSVVVNLAAQAGVRYSIENPDAYINSNIYGFYNILEACRYSYNDGQPGVQHLVYASSSSVYGGNKKVPFGEDDPVDHPVSLYAATKKSNELMAHAYSKLYNIPCTGLRFFTVYGPAGRPDMAYFSFTEKLRRAEKIQIFNYGDCRRDFTYIDDIVEGIVKVIQSPPGKLTGPDGLAIPPYAIYNIGNSHPENLMEFVSVLSEELIRAKVLSPDFDIGSHMELIPMQKGDVPVTYADTSKLEQDFGYRPHTDLRIGLRFFAEWYKNYYNI